MLKPVVSRLGIALITLLMLVALASTAQALTFTVTSDDTLGPIAVGEEIDLELTIDASDLVGLGSTFGYGISLLIGGDAVWETVLAGDGGVGLQNTGQFEVDAGTFGIVGGAQQAGLEPQNTVFSDVVTMATFISGTTPADGINLDFTNAYNTNFVASVTLRLVDAGTMSSVSITPGDGPGDSFDLSGVDILQDATFNGVTILIPEPHAAALSLASLGCVLGITGLRRRRLTSIVD